MSELAITCVDVRPDLYAAAPTMVFRLRVTESTGVRVHAIALRCQIRIEPARRRYDAGEAERLLELFGETPQWGDSLKPMQFASVGVMVASFAGQTEVDVPVAYTYDFEVGTAKYFHGLAGGEIPMLLLFSGTAFRRTDDGGFEVEQVPWSLEARYRVPVTVWRDLMDRFFPNSGWIRLRSDTIDALQRYKAGKALPTWEDAFAALLKQAGEYPP
ncbi:DUF6084 family protein [Pseudonocardia nigra]|uniref:DUF6084 family protein n=1 Tax=Pseudonocardia nigra TaxID=1921578 RepID=UPI001C5E92CF|nr:DUF6084 family protein [Pseudonocardia nigra]